MVGVVAGVPVAEVRCSVFSDSSKLLIELLREPLIFDCVAERERGWVVGGQCQFRIVK